MYEISCPYCGHDNITSEIDGFFNKYAPHECEKCKKTYFILQRSWWDLTYDPHNVEVRKAEWFNAGLKKKGLERCGKAVNKKTGKVFTIYRRTNLYDEFGGEEAVMKIYEDYFKKF